MIFLSDFILIPVIFLFFLYFILSDTRDIFFLSLIVSFIIFYKFLYFTISFNKTIFNYQFIERVDFHSLKYFFNTFEYEYIVGLDNISLLLILLTSFLFPICILYSWVILEIRSYKQLIIYLYLLIFCLFQSFLVLDFFFFLYYLEGKWVIEELWLLQI
jgi:NADH-quinone oxidoreductase subunit M